MESYHHVKEVGQIYYKVKLVHVNLSYYKSQIGKLAQRMSNCLKKEA